MGFVPLTLAQESNGETIRPNAWLFVEWFLLYLNFIGDDRLFFNIFGREIRVTLPRECTIDDNQSSN